MKIKDFFIKLAAGMGAIFSAVFYVLYKQKKQEELEQKNKQLEKEVQEAEAKAEEEFKFVEAIEQNNEVKKENEKELQNCAGNHLSNFNAGLDLLRK